MSLTGRDRVNRMFARADHDRVPRYDSYWPETLRRWQMEANISGEDEVLARLGADFFSVGAVWPSPYPDQVATLDESEEWRVVRNEWGATLREWKHRDGTPEHIGFDCYSPDRWRSVYKPMYTDGRIHTDLNAIRERYAKAYQPGQWCMWHCAESFETTRKLLGDEIVMMAMATDPEWVVDVSRTYTDQLLREFEVVHTLGIPFDGVFMWSDMAYNRGTFCSPTMYRDIIWPDHKRIADWVHDHGMKIIFHTDGNVNGVMDLYVEAGFDCLQPLEAKANMDLLTLLPRYSERLAFMGNVNVMTMLTNDRARIEEELLRKVQAGMATRGYVYHSDHSIPPQVEWKTYEFIIDLLDRCASYA